MISADIINIRHKYQKSTVKICSKGGINAANEFSDLKVYRVQVVSQAPKTKREKGSSQPRDPNPSRSASFAAALERALDESQPVDCYTVTYDASSKLQTFFYQPSREYTL